MAIEQENGMYINEIASVLTANPRSVHDFVRRHKIPRERSITHKGVIVDVPAYIAQARALGYTGDANILERHLAARNRGQEDVANPS